VEIEDILHEFPSGCGVDFTAYECKRNADIIYVT